MLIQLSLKTLHFAGELGKAERLGLNFSVVDQALGLLKAQREVEIAGGTMVGRASYRYRISDAGRARAALFLESNHYVGVAPVPFDQCRRYMLDFQGAAPQVKTRDRVRDAFRHLVISQHVLDQLVPAINAGPRCSSTARRGTANGDLSVDPQAAGWDDRDSTCDSRRRRDHPPVRSGQSRAGRERRGSRRGLDLGSREDRRWIRCRRPMVMVGGELTLEQLELSPTTGFYRAPVQAVANGGVLVIDDFGRQQVAPRDLLNRWIVPLESRVDFLTLQSGQKFELPFMVLVIFATNIKPAEVVDEAFLRRIHYKVFAESPTVVEFMQIFENCCQERELRSIAR